MCTSKITNGQNSIVGGTLQMDVVLVLEMDLPIVNWRGVWSMFVKYNFKYIGLHIIYFKQYDNITIHMKRYSICINDTFCLVLDPKSLIWQQISWELGDLNDRNTLHLSKNVSFEVLCN